MAKKEEALVVKEESALARPTWLDADSRRGTENMQREDIQLPRVALAQPLSPQVVDVMQRIEGLNVGNMFNALTGDILGNGPLLFMPVFADRARGVQFKDIKDGGGVLDFDVPLDDPRMQFTTNDKGERVKPTATKFYDYVVVLLESAELVAISFKGMGLKVAKQLNGLINARKADMFAGRYSLTSKVVSKGGFTYATFEVKNAGWVTEEQFAVGAKYYEQLKTKNVVIDRGTAGEAAAETGDVPF